MENLKTLADIRREYGELILSEQNLPNNPLSLFNQWLADIVNMDESIDATAMVLSTVDKNGHPDSRVVLLKGIEEGLFTFYTNYLSEKGEQLKVNPHAALNFYWPILSRQVRIKGFVQKSASACSDQYFHSRPIASQIGAIVSAQSQRIPDREFLEQAFNQVSQTTAADAIARPDYWGGYQLTPVYIEFWQGRNNRLHDRIAYCRQEEEWNHYRLAP